PRHVVARGVQPRLLAAGRAGGGDDGAGEAAGRGPRQRRLAATRRLCGAERGRVPRSAPQSLRVAANRSEGRRMTTTRRTFLKSAALAAAVVPAAHVLG